MVLIFAANDAKSAKGYDVLRGLNNPIQEGLVFAGVSLAATNSATERE